MQLIDIEAILRERSGRKYPKWMISLLSRVIHQQEINFILKSGEGLKPQQFLQHTLQMLHISYHYNGKLPSKNKRCIFVANHPYGGLDGIILAEILLQHYADVGVVVNDLLMNLKPLQPLWIPINKFGRQNTSSSLIYNQAMTSPTKQILTFPAGICSRWDDGRVTDLRWHSRFVRDAIRHNRMIVPIHIAGRLSSLFYTIYRLRRLLGIDTNLELILLVDELFKQKGQEIEITFGKAIDATTLNGTYTERCDHVRHLVDGYAS